MKNENAKSMRKKMFLLYYVKTIPRKTHKNAANTTYFPL